MLRITQKQAEIYQQCVKVKSNKISENNNADENHGKFSSPEGYKQISSLWYFNPGSLLKPFCKKM